jgi:hypothetical protein
MPTLFDTAAIADAGLTTGAPLASAALSRLMNAALRPRPSSTSTPTGAPRAAAFRSATTTSTSWPAARSASTVFAGSRWAR